MNEFRAELMDGQSAVIRELLVGGDPSGLRLVEAGSGAEVGFWPVKGLQVESLPPDLFHLTHESAPGALLSSRAPELPAILRACGLLVAPPMRGRRLQRMAAIYAGAIALLVTAIYLSLPGVCRLLARRVPLDVEERLGGQVEALLGDSTCRTEGATAALRRLTERVSLGAGEGPTARSVEVIDLEMVNAFTFPGGKVMLTRGLIDAAESSDEVAGVLAHELEHVRQRHVMAYLIRSSLLSLGWAVTVGDFSGLFVLDPSTMFNVATRSFSRKDERSADEGALARLDRAGIPRAGFAAFFQRIAKQSDVIPAWLSTHPASAERIATISGGAPKVATGAAQSALSASDWQAIKSACQGRPPSDGRLRRWFRGDKRK